MISVVDYDPAWPQQFEALRLEYTRSAESAGVRVLTIEHVGSTAVPGLAAKPVIDCDIVVAEADVGAAGTVLIGLGFRPLGELGIPQTPAAHPAAGEGICSALIPPILSAAWDRETCCTPSMGGGCGNDW